MTWKCLAVQARQDIMFSVVKWLEVYLELDRSFASFDKLGSGACFSDVPIITGPRTLFLVCIQD